LIKTGTENGKSYRSPDTDYLFIIWIFSSISASKKKQQPAPPERGPHPFPEYPQESPPPSSTNPVEDLKRTLESIFSEMAGESPKTVEQKPSPKKPCNRQQSQLQSRYRKRLPEKKPPSTPLLHKKNSPIGYLTKNFEMLSF
jgi:hypothetical protein